MNRYYFYKRRSEDIREDLQGDLIDFSLSALYSTKEYSQKLRKEISQFHYFDQIHLCLSTKTPGIFQVNLDSGTDGCHGHHSNSLQDLKNCFSKDGYCLITERQYFRLRKLAMRLIFLNIQFFVSKDEGAERKFIYQNIYSRNFYDIKLVSTSEKHNIRNYNEYQISYAQRIGLPLKNLRIDEYFKVFVSKNKDYKSTKIQIESSHFSPFYENYDNFKSSFLLKERSILELQAFQFERLKKMLTELIFQRSELDISSIIPKQLKKITILEI